MMRIELSLPENMVWIQAVMVLLVLAGLLLGILHDMRFHMLGVYNWDGRRYRFLGKARIRKARRGYAGVGTGDDTYVIKISERMWDLSYTTRYLLVPSKQFVHRNRNGSLLLQAGKETAWLPIEARMRQDIYYRLRDI
ncbi:MAG: hypothetical protein J6A08_13900 [Lachnospiraceae bacterium]|nr:hypothetical protein [Lachnospiraceae bacterium]